MPSKKIRNRNKNQNTDNMSEDVKAPNLNDEHKSRSKKDDDYRSRY